MKQIAWLFKWFLKVAIFFTLFAFALNNQGDATVHFFFGYAWTAPLVLVVLCAFAIGMVVGVLGMVPRWWRHRKAAANVRITHGWVTNANKQDADKVQSSVPNGL